MDNLLAVASKEDPEELFELLDVVGHGCVTQRRVPHTARLLLPRQSSWIAFLLMLNVALSQFIPTGVYCIIFPSDLASHSLTPALAYLDLIRSVANDFVLFDLINSEPSAQCARA
jgi:hypothetical protein